MMYKYKSDQVRKSLLETALKGETEVSDRITINLDEAGGGTYCEIITGDEFQTIFTEKAEYAGLVPMQMAKKLVNERIEGVLESLGYEVDQNEIDYESSDFYDGYEMRIPFKKSDDFFNESTLFNELDSIFNKSDRGQNESSIGGRPRPKYKGDHTSKINGISRPNRAGNTPLNKEPNKAKTGHIPLAAKKEKTQNPRKVDLMLKSTFESVFNDYTLSTDVGKWKPTKSAKGGEKLLLVWEHTENNTYKIETLIFPENSNKISVKVKKSDGATVTNHIFEVYRIPTDSFQVERFFRKTFFNQLKKFVDTKVILLEPFMTEFIFWKTDNPFFSYSFSSPKKNKILKDLIAFISTARKPILDDFFEQNNLKHKQGYLQNLLDAAEAAGIFKFAREGNEIVILRGVNYKAFLDGKIRRVM